MAKACRVARMSDDFDGNEPTKNLIELLYRAFHYIWRRTMKAAAKRVVTVDLVRRANGRVVQNAGNFAVKPESAHARTVARYKPALASVVEAGRKVLGSR